MFSGDDVTDLFVWDRSNCLDPKIPDGETKQLLSRTLTGHTGFISSILCTATSLISSDVAGLVIERDFWNCIKEKESIRFVSAVPNLGYVKNLKGFHQFKNYTKIINLKMS